MKSIRQLYFSVVLYDMWDIQKFEKRKESDYWDQTSSFTISKDFLYFITFQLYSNVVLQFDKKFVDR